MFTLLLVLFASTCANPVDDFISGRNLFAAEVHKEEAKLSNGNFLVSPFAAELLLSLTHYGANGKTAEELRTALHFPSNDAMKKNFLKYFDDLDSKTVGEDFDFWVANKIYVTEDTKIDENFKEIATEVFMADVENIDFSQNEDASNSINTWVEEETEGVFSEIIKPTCIDDSARAVMISAVLFKDSWYYPFAKGRTKPINFTTVDNKVIQVDAMFSDAHNFIYFDDNILNAEIFVLPLKTPGFFVSIVLPHKTKKLEELEEQVEEIFDRPVDEMDKIQIVLPKFVVQNDIDFEEILQNLGIQSLFTEEADLSGLGEDLHVDKIIQKSFVGIDENGVAAGAAATVSETNFNPSDAKQVVVDRPFLFTISWNNFIMFSGRVLNPKE